MSPLTDADVDANESRGARSKREVILRGGRSGVNWGIEKIPTQVTKYPKIP